MSYYRASLWFLASIIIACGNDIISKYVKVHPFSVAFWRFAIAAISLLPFVILQSLRHTEGRGSQQDADQNYQFSRKGRILPNSKRWSLHLLRAFIFALAIVVWNIGLKMVPIVAAIAVTFTIPLIVLLISHLFLGERIAALEWLFAILGFIGVVIVLNPKATSIIPLIMFLFCAFVFAIVDIINQFMLKRGESSLFMLFYSAIFAAGFVFVPHHFYGNKPSLIDGCLLTVLALNSNMMLYCMLTAFKHASVASLVPLRYTELIVAVLAGYFIFDEVPHVNMHIGSFLIVLSSLGVYHCNRNKVLS